ncbi:MAG: RES family NAD+ phosphorylase [Myxococcales bacterium]|nr:RES family NAD+ phosphorylase [Myxococcales bacterium]
MIVFRHADPRFPFLWETDAQPEARWHAPGEGPVQYFADTPDGAWAEFLRHEDIKTVADLATVSRALWVVELPDEPFERPTLGLAVTTGDRTTYPACQTEARRLRAGGTRRLLAPSAALLPGAARGLRVDTLLVPGADRDGTVTVVFGRRPDLVGWAAAGEGRPRPDMFPLVRYF